MKNPQATATSFAELVKDAMHENGISIRELARQSGVTYEHVRASVREHIVPSLDTVKVFASKLGIDQELAVQLATADKIKKKYKTEIAQITQRDPEIAPIEALFHRLSVEQKRTVVDLVKTMANQRTASK